MGIEDDFYATIKFKSGEEIFARIAASEEEDRTMLILHYPIIIAELKGKQGIIGYKVEPWLKTSREDMFVVNMDNVLTLSECADVEMIVMYNRYLKDCEEDKKDHIKNKRQMGYLSSVNDAKIALEKIYKDSSNSSNNQ
tara:strand:+ start:1063 stop:1479 length:417 start_codon:yes stop_codon:yes gene_type:complete